MAISTYAELQTAVGNWLLRTDLTDRIPEFIAMAEARMNRDSRLRVIDAIARDTLAVSGQFTSLPADFGRMVNCERQDTPVVPLEYLTPQQMDAYRSANPSGPPLYFSIIGNELETVPVTDDSETLGIIYYKRIVPLSDAATSNWLLAAAPDVYLYATLIEASPYLHEDERVPVWEMQYERRVDAYRASSEADQTTDAPLLMRGTVIGG